MAFFVLLFVIDIALPESIKQKRFEIRNTNMKMKTVNKVKFARLNDKRYYFSETMVHVLFAFSVLVV